MADLKGKVALIDGAGAMLGAGVAAGLAEAGATVYLADRVVDEAESAVAETLERAAAQVRELGGQAITHLFQQQTDQSIAELFVRIASEQDRLDLLVNNISLFQPPGCLEEAFWEAPVSFWDYCAPLTLRDSYLRSAHAARLMVPAGSGLIVNLALCADADCAGNLPQQSVSAGMTSMTMQMAGALGQRGVSVLALDPEVDGSAIPATETFQADPVDAGIPQQARYLGRCIAALTMDPDIAEKNAAAYSISELAREYRFSRPAREMLSP